MSHDETLGMLADAASTACFVYGGLLLLFVLNGLLELWWRRKDK
jgi:hypothetical protein